MGSKQIEEFSDIILRILRVLAESSGVVKTPQLKTSKLGQNCGKTENLHLQPSYGICRSHEIETLPPM
jgi:hypothetical protein